MASKLLKRYGNVEVYQVDKLFLKPKTVSFCKEDKSVHYVGNVPNYFVATHDVKSTSSKTRVLGSGFTLSQVQKMYIDDVEVTPTKEYSFSSTGIHTVKCHFNDDNNDNKLTTCHEMFRSCGTMIDLEINNLNTTNVTSMNCMFNYCSGLTHLDMSTFYTAKVTDMTAVFQYCSGLTSLNIDGWNTTNVTTMLGLFRFCCNLEVLNITHFHTPNLTNMQGMFEHSEKIPSMDLSSFDLNKVTTMYCLFNKCYDLKEVKLPTFYSSINVDYMFQDVANNGKLLYLCSNESVVDSKIINSSRSHLPPRNWSSECY